MAPRVSMFVGVDTLGNVYLSLTQSNSNREVMSIFLQQLVLKLDKERKHWRRDTVILHDGASYWDNDDILDLLRQLEVPAMTLGPYSYLVAPVELYFAAFKKADINPRHLPTTKAHFSTVLDLVVRRCQEIPRP